MTDNEVCANCINCSVGPIVQIISFLGTPYISLSCKHKNNISKTYVEYSKLRLFMGLIVCGILILSAVHGYGHLKYCISISTGELFDVVISIPGVISPLTTFAAICSLILQVKSVIMVIDGAEKLMHAWLKRKNDVLLTVEDVTYLRNQAFLYLFFILTCSIVVTIMQFGLNTPDLNLSIIEKIGTTLSFYVEMITVAGLVTLLQLSRLMSSRVYCYLKLDLELARARRRKLNLKESISMHIQFHTSIKKILGCANAFVSPFGIIILLDGIIIFISSLFIVIMCLLKDDVLKLLTPQLLIHEFHFLICILLFTYIIYLCGQLSKKLRDSLSYLYQYPISRLNREEAFQIEHLTKTLRIQKPVIIISDMFPLALDMYVLVSGTVLTYVLVIFQFQNLWTKH